MEHRVEVSAEYPAQRAGPWLAEPLLAACGTEWIVQRKFGIVGVGVTRCRIVQWEFEIVGVGVIRCWIDPHEERAVPFVASVVNHWEYQLVPIHLNVCTWLCV